MASNNLWIIIRAIQHGGEITPRQVRQLLGCDSKKACRLLEHLVSAGAVKNIGKPRHPVFVMQPDGESRIKPISVTRQNPGIAEVCRQNWQGYQIHKIIGSARA
ncbi:TPA: hypothetical protein N2299_000973 [Enterobacter hormaechei]|uniref:hypothetical protein n=1 Tax=Enterobacter cloacae complex TaxID=354276 RepID=UPI000BC8D465|nr:hypothetical protein [Enterobacter hormaechei]PAC69040.1 hypothetical protein CGS27_18475 [Enterobacter cloacae]HAV1441054.1 hypothetical protein [Enterobacter hormaechei subsp. xiangfangensis]ELS4596216.1 hypothetical protein [Enterobacter hormaechei]MED5624083.1 hypothetical protein [Enterobacter hormaechei]MED5714372.1 hypothetical protein [Enterobacter hormaechei]